MRDHVFHLFHETSNMSHEYYIHIYDALSNIKALFISSNELQYSR